MLPLVPRRQQEAIWNIYERLGALNISCPDCSAPQQVFCRSSDGRLRRTPCLGRISKDTEPGQQAYQETQPLLHQFGGRARLHGAVAPTRLTHNNNYEEI
ncbi:hypothetical protein I549_5906 [Mycobacterium avium subsp. avium 2285 (R)]|nr:hypothetical protein I549_5906 [Mycobacterium avium subsp. avium 2285 (R)]